MNINIKQVDQTFKAIIEAQARGNLTGEEFLKLKELQTLTKKLNELEKEYREVVDEVMSR